MISTKLSKTFIKNLFALPTQKQWAEQLKTDNLLNKEGLDQLLDVAERSIRNDPGQAQQLAAFCQEMATTVHAPTIIPRATYLQAQSYALNGEFEMARTYIQSAQTGYLHIGEPLAALRTNIGLMHILNELGDHEAVLDAGQTVLDAVENEAWSAGDEKSSPTNLLAALAHQNRGICFWQIGRYEEALTAYTAAEGHYHQLDSPESLGDISNNRGLVLLCLGRVREAYQAFENAAAIRAKAGATLQQAQTHNNMAEAQLLLGNYTECLALLEQSKALLTPLNAAADWLTTLRLQGNAYLSLNLFTEALATYREALPLLRQANVAYQLANTLWRMGKVLVALRQFEEATKLLAEAKTLFHKSDNVPLLTNVLLEQSVLSEQEGKQALALAQTEEALALISAGDWPVQQIYTYLRMADLLLPDVAEAERYLQKASYLMQKVKLPHLQYQLNQRLGHLRLQMGENEAAEKFLRQAVHEIEQLRQPLPQEAMRTSFLSDKVAAYEDLIQLYLSQSNESSVQQAFSIAEQAKSRTLVDLLAGTIEASPEISTNQGWATQLQDLQADLNVIYNEMLQGENAAEDERTVRVSNLQERAVTLEQEISRLRLQLSINQRPTEATQSPLLFDAIQATMAHDGTLLAYYILDEEIMAFITIAGHVHVLRHISSTHNVQNLLDKIAIQWERFHLGHSFVKRHMKTLERSVQRSFHSLYCELMDPVEAFLKSQTQPSGATTDGVDIEPEKLIIVPHGLLHLVPFHALHDGTSYLLERYEISYAPSVTTLAFCEKQRPRMTNQALVIGVPDPRIPAVKREVQAVAHQLQQSSYEVDICLDQEATLAILPDKADACRIIHIACHGLFRADNPMFSALKLHDGWLTAADIMQLDLTGAIVTLSACESGRGYVLGGDEIIGLTRAVLGAGAASLLVSQWLVQDEATAALMTAWYEQLQQPANLASALRKAQLAVKEQYAHPYYWAPFMLIGQRTPTPLSNIFNHLYSA